MPPLGGSAEVRWSPGRVRIEGGVRWAAAQPRLSARDRDDPRIDPDGTAGFFTVHGAAALGLGSTDLVLRDDNVLDRRYREHGSGTDAPGLGIGVAPPPLRNPLICLHSFLITNFRIME